MTSNVTGNATGGADVYNTTMRHLKDVFNNLVIYHLVSPQPRTGMSEQVQLRFKLMLESRYGPMLVNYPSLMGRLYLIICCMVNQKPDLIFLFLCLTFKFHCSL